MLGLFKKINNLFFEDMGIQIGPWDPLKLTFNIMDNLMRRNIISYDDAVEILTKSLPEDYSQEQKQEIIGKMITKRTN